VKKRYTTPQVHQLFTLCSAAGEERWSDARYRVDLECKTCGDQDRTVLFASEALEWLVAHVGHRTFVQRTLSGQKPRRRPTGRQQQEPIRIDEAILVTLRASTAPLSPQEIAKAIDRTPECVKRHLLQLEQANEVRCVQRGTYGRGNHALWVAEEASAIAA
jgi:hypothetical protein